MLYILLIRLRNIRGRKISDIAQHGSAVLLYIISVACHYCTHARCNITLLHCSGYNLASAMEGIGQWPTEKERMQHNRRQDDMLHLTSPAHLRYSHEAFMVLPGDATGSSVFKGGRREYRGRHTASVLCQGRLRPPNKGVIFLHSCFNIVIKIGCIMDHPLVRVT